jgi:hypothetical protein
MGIQFNQIDNLQTTFNSLSGNLQGQITPLNSSVTGIASGEYTFVGHKYFSDNVDFSGAQGILVGSNNIYATNNIYAGAIKIGATIAEPRSSTAAPDGQFQVTGGTSFFDGPLTMRNASTITSLIITGGSGQFHRGFFGETTASGLTVSGSTDASVTFADLPTGSGSLTSGELFRSGNHIMIV